MDIKTLFEQAENGTFTYDQFVEATKQAKAKFVDLSEGSYISKQKYDSDLAGRDGQIQTLNDTITQRDSDLSTLKDQLAQAGTDATKLGDLQTQFNTLQGKYDTDTKNYKAQLAKQAYEFAVKDFANSKKFTSNAAKRDFINSMIAKDLKLENDKILGADDFVTAYSADNADAFVVETPDNADNSKPKFADSTNNNAQHGSKDDSNAFHFDFLGVRKHE